MFSLRLCTGEYPYPIDTREVVTSRGNHLGLKHAYLRARLGRVFRLGAVLHTCGGYGFLSFDSVLALLNPKS